MNNNGRGFGGRTSVYQEVSFLAKKHHIKTAIETGTHKGDTTLALAEIFDEVHTIESNRDYYTDCLEKLSGSSTIQCHFGNSPDWLNSFLPGCRRPTFFYLDAHWYEYWPILDELRAIAMCGPLNAVIAIDDFQVTDRPDLGFDTYNDQPLNWSFVKDDVAKIYAPTNCFHHFYNNRLEGTGKGVVFIEPIGEGVFCNLC